MNLWSLLLLLACSLPVFADTAQLRQDSPLYQQPDQHSLQLQALTAGTELTLQQRQQDWIQVKTASRQGWLPIIHLSLPPMTDASLSNLPALTAKPELADQLDRFHVSRQQVERAARQRGLSLQSIEQPNHGG